MTTKEPTVSTDSQDLRAAHDRQREASAAFIRARAECEMLRARAEAATKALDAAVGGALCALFSGRADVDADRTRVVVGEYSRVDIRGYDRGWVATCGNTVIGPIPDWDDFGRELVALVDSIINNKEPAP